MLITCICCSQAIPILGQQQFMFKYTPNNLKKLESLLGKQATSSVMKRPFCFRLLHPGKQKGDRGQQITLKWKAASTACWRSWVSFRLKKNNFLMLPAISFATTICKV